MITPRVTERLGAAAPRFRGASPVLQIGDAASDRGDKASGDHARRLPPGARFDAGEFAREGDQVGERGLGVLAEVA